MKNLKFLAVGLLAVVILTACSTNTFYDDFSEHTGEWDLLLDDIESAIFMINGTLELDLRVAHAILLTSIEQEYSDVSLQVEAQSVGSATVDEFGLICRYNGEDDFYAAMIGSDGYFGIYKGDPDYDYTDISDVSYGRNEEILEMGTIYEMRMDCIGNSISLYVNDLEIISVQDDSFTSGQVGVIISSWDQPDVYVAFDNFSAEPAK